MRIESVRIQNFRAFVDETIDFNDYTCLLGPNGGGKSTVLTALNIFFRDTAHARTDLLKLDKEDFHHGNTADPVVITVTFTDLSEEAQEDLKVYYRQGKLIVSAKAEWNDDDGFAQVLQYGERLGIEAFKSFFKEEGDGTSVAELKKIYAQLRQHYSKLPSPGTKQAMIDALRAYETEHSDECVLIPSADQFYGVSKGANRLQKYVQWAFVPAVKDACDEQVESKKGVLGMLLERTVRAQVSFDERLRTMRKTFCETYEEMLDGQQHVLNGISGSLSRRLSVWAHPNATLELKWQNDPQSSIRVAEPLARVVAGEGLFKGKLARFGHGFQRSFILTLLEELAGYDGGIGPKLILACEEPELFQHPPQARHVADVMQRLSTKNAQVMVCTHSPYFVSGRYVEDVRSIRTAVGGGEAECKAVTFDDVAGDIAMASGEQNGNPAVMELKLQQSLQPELNEIFFTNVLILVEGLEDVAYIVSYLTLTDRWEEFRRLGCHIVPAGGKSSVPQPLAIAKRLGIPTFVVFDADGDKVPKANEPDANGKRKMHETENNCILAICKLPDVEPFPTGPFWEEGTVMWDTDLTDVVKREIGAEDWNMITSAVRSAHRIDEAGIKKNSMYIGYCLAKALEEKKEFPSLSRLCDSILAFAEKARLIAGPEAGSRKRSTEPEEVGS